MKYQQLHDQFFNQGFFSLQQLRLIDQGFRIGNITDWKKKGTIRDITKGRYCFSKANFNETHLATIANQIYSPSYISMEKALRHYNLIPEGVFMETSITTKKNQILQGDLGTFKYNHVKPSLFWGYHLEKNTSGGQYLLADIEKAICDFLYLKPHYNNETELEEWRIDGDELHEQINRNKLEQYAIQFRSKALLKRVRLFIHYFKNNA